MQLAMYFSPLNQLKTRGQEKPHLFYCALQFKASPSSPSQILFFLQLLPEKMHLPSFFFSSKAKIAEVKFYG